eukprot:4563486-Amphidinium_carterae.1
MSRYALNPEPRRMWLSLMSRIGSLQSEPLFAAVMDRHMVQTGVRTIQSLESVLTFTISIEAEVDAIVQDQVSTGGTGSSRQQARGNSASASDSSLGNNKNNNKNGSSGSSEANAAGVPLSNKSAGKSSGSDKLDLCKLWGTQEGCRFGKTCKFHHPNAKVSDGLCFICGAKSHRSKECKLRTATGDKPAGSSGNISVCDVNYCVTEDGTPVYGQPFPESSVEIAEQSGCKASLESSTIDPVVDVLQQLTRSADRLSDSLMCCSNNMCSERFRVNSEVSERTSSCENLTETRDAAFSAT